MKGERKYSDAEIDYMRDEARKFDGFFAGQFEPDEYQPYLDAGVLRKVWNGTAGLLGLSKLEVVP